MMIQTSLTPAAQRLERLAAYLREDPENPALLAEACEAAIASGEHAQAQQYIDAAARLALASDEWTFRRARLAIARRELGEAARLLEGLLASAGAHPVLAHDLAYVRLLAGDPAGSKALLAPWMAEGAAAGLPAEQQQALQVLWLRAAHRLQGLEEAMDWIRARVGEGKLHAAAQGVASLIALDAGEFETAQVLAEAALAADAEQLEALVASGSLALGRGDTAAATRRLERALERHPDDGRTWSALGFASLHSMQLPQAQQQLERAVAAMPDHVDSWHALGWTRLLRGDHEGSVKAFRQALSVDPDRADTHAALALVLAMAGDAAGAKVHLSQVERVDADNAMGRYARTLLAGGADTEGAQALVRGLLGEAGGQSAALPEAIRARLRGLH